MKKLFLALPVLLLISLFAYFQGCSDNDPVISSNSTQSLDVSCPPQDVWSGQTNDVGDVTLTSDNNNFIINVILTSPIKNAAEAVKLYLNGAQPPSGLCKRPTGNEYTYKSPNPYIVISSDRMHIVITIPKSEVTLADGCMYMFLHFDMADGNTAFGGNTPRNESCGNGSWFYFAQFCNNCWQDPPPPPSNCTDPGEFRTQTQGGWGAPPHGGNPGTYLHDNFSGAFPNGVTIGCSTGYKITLTSASAVTAFLPQGGKPKAITQNYLNPSNKITVLAGQVLALKLSVGFDIYDDDFGASTINLKDLVYVANGSPLYGLTVEQILNLGEQILGGCSTAFTPAQINEAIANINETFVDGTMAGNVLICPTSLKK